MKARIQRDDVGDSAERNRLIAASPRSVRLLLSGFALCAVLFSFELGHYLISTDVGATDHLPSAWANVHPQCQELGSRFDLRCPFPGYNSVQMVCLWDMCSFGDPDSPPTTQQDRDNYVKAIRTDAIDSLRVEQPYAAGSAWWRQHAADLRSGTMDVPKAVVLDRRVETIPEAQELIKWRALNISRQVANDWLAQHAG